MRELRLYSEIRNLTKMDFVIIVVVVVVVVIFSFMIIRATSGRPTRGTTYTCKRVEIKTLTNVLATVLLYKSIDTLLTKITDPTYTARRSAWYCRQSQCKHIPIRCVSHDIKENLAIKVTCNLLRCG